jgi:hypothetical protein
MVRRVEQGDFAGATRFLAKLAKTTHVIPAKAGISVFLLAALKLNGDSCFRRNDTAG